MNIQDRNYKKLHNDLLFLLCRIKEICEKENIWYSLAYGTALGAVRHNGFIPWDLDADIYIKLEDVDRLRTAFAENAVEGVTLINCDETPRCAVSLDIVKYEHDVSKADAHVDIFPLIGAPPGKLARTVEPCIYSYLEKVLRAKYADIKRYVPKSRIAVRCAKIIGFFIPDRLIKKINHKIRTKYSIDNTEYLMTYPCEPGSGACMPKILFEETIVHKFETTEFTIPKDWDTYLTLTYGSDYMTPKIY